MHLDFNFLYAIKDENDFSPLRETELMYLESLIQKKWFKKLKYENYYFKYSYNLLDRKCIAYHGPDLPPGYVRPIDTGTLTGEVNAVVRKLLRSKGF